MSPQQLDRFMAKVEKQDEVTSPHVNTPCWIWTGTLRNGYGAMSVGHRGDGTAYAHRLAYAHWGADPGCLFVCHRCDTRACVRHSHLFLGTAADNVTDMEQKGRSVHVLGVRNGRAKLNAESAAAIADLLSQGRLPREVAAQFGVHRTTVSNIGRGKTWSHITGIGAVS